jgi:pimeloyl-ACP methyl ester carboxylesterase
MATEFAQTRFGPIAYRVDGVGPPLVLLQRFRGAMDDWDPAFLAPLSAVRTVIRFDNLGVGETPGEAPDTVAGMAQAAIGFLETLDLGPVDLLGWSLGGYVAQLVALEAPTRLLRLVIAGSGPGRVPEGPAAHPRVAEIAAKVSADPEDLLFLFFTDTSAGQAAGRAYLQRVHATPRPPVIAETGARQLTAIGAWTAGQGDARPRLAELRLPVLVANGVADVMVPAFRSFILAREAPFAKLILYPDAGHAFLFQHADGFVRDLLAFLSEPATA